MSAVLEARGPSARHLAGMPSAALRQFELLATAPEGVARLRQLILSLAVRGRIFPQQAARQPVGDTAANLPCPLPIGWQWARLSDLGQFRGGKTPSTQRTDYWGGAIPWITPKDMKQLRLSDAQDHVTKKATEDGLALIPPGSLLIVVRSGILRRTVPTAINDVETTINQDLKALVFVRPELAPYVQLLVRGFEEFILEKLTKVGTTVESIQFDAFASQPFPLPPLAEQARIVARVDDLMRLCDSLEAKGRLAAEQHACLLGALLGTLTNSATPEELAANWQRVAAHFDLLLDRPEAVDALEQTILQLAVRGELVPEDPKDETGASLLARLATLRGAKFSRGEARIGTSNGCPPYELPVSWQWAPLGDLVENMGSGWSPACEEGARGDLSQWAVLRTTAVQQMEYRPSEHKVIPSKLAPRPEIQVKPGDILITRAGPMNRVGISCWVAETPERLMLSDKIVRFRPVADEMLPAFLVLALNAGWTKDQLERAKTGMAASQVNISQADLKRLMVPVCSHSQQARIVSRVIELLRLCADLRQRLVASQATQSNLAAALVEQTNA